MNDPDEKDSEGTERLQRRVAVLEMVIAEELYPNDCADDANRMIVEGIHVTRQCAVTSRQGK